MNYCFETDSLRRIFLTLFPERRDEAFSVCELVQKIAPFSLSSEEERLTHLKNIVEKEALPFPIERLPRLLFTLEKLRESLILSPEHLEFCFSSLPPTPKNTALKKALEIYLQSPLSQDLTKAVWTAIESLKNKTVSDKFEPKWIFVKETSGSFLFHELAKALTYAPGVQESQVASLWQILPSSENNPEPVSLGTPVSSLEALAQRIHEKSDRGTCPVLVPFHASSEKAAYLKMRLISKDIYLKEVEETGPNQIEKKDFFSRLRASTSLPLDTRLKVWHQMKTLRTLLPAGISTEEVVERYLAKEEIDPEVEKKIKKVLDEQNAPTEPRLENDPEIGHVFLIPWTALPIDSASQVAYCDETLLHVPRHQLLLTHTEIEDLFFAGFTLPRTGELREFRLRVLQELSQRGVELFTSLPQNELEEFAVKPIAIPKEPKPTIEKVSSPLAIPPSHFSATQLETYAACPARYLYSNRMRFRKDPINDDRTALLFGQCTHWTLEHFFEKHEPDTGLWESRLHSLFLESLQATIPSLDSKHMTSRLLREMFKPIARSFPRLERELGALFPGAKPTYFEKDFKIDYHQIDQRTSLVGKIDRIDTLSDDSLLVIDYKTGMVDFSPEHIKKGSHFQALLYLFAAETLFQKKVAGVLFYDLKRGELRRGIFQEELLSKETKKFLTRGHTLTLDKFSLVRDLGFEHLRKITSRIQKGDFEATPSAEACRFCEFRSFCRSAYGAV